MRIISKFRDYYDSAMGMGIDPNLVYVRKTEDIDIKIKSSSILDMTKCPRDTHISHMYGVRTSILGFCGKLYPLYRLLQSGKYTIGFATLSRLFSHLRNLEDLSWEDYDEFGKRFNNESKKNTYYMWERSFNKERCEEFRVELTRINALDLFFELKCPCFIVTDIKIITNPNLKDIGFATKVDPYTAFQEISMFIGGVIGSNKDGPPITDDKVLRDSKGFDDKSFKTRAPGRKANRARNKGRKNG